MTIQVEIMPCGTKAKECNPYGKQAPCTCVFPNDDMCTYPVCKNKWQKAESERKEYEIEKVKCVCLNPEDEHKCGYPLCQEEMKPGSIVKGIIVNNHKIKIV